MNYAEIVVRFGRIVCELSGHLYIDFVCFDPLRKRERKSGEAAPIGGGGLCLKRLAVVGVEIEGCLDGDVGDGTAANGVNGANADGVMTGFSNEFRSRHVQLKNSGCRFANREDAREGRRHGVRGCVRGDGVTQAIPQELLSINFVDQGRDEGQRGFELRYAGGQRGVLFGMTANLAGRGHQFEKDVRRDRDARWIFYRQINGGVVGEKFDASSFLLHVQARLRVARAEGKKTENYGSENTAGSVTHRPPPQGYECDTNTCC